MEKNIPHFEIVNKFQKRDYTYEDIITKDILKEISYKITGILEYTVNFDNTGYNKGRLATLEYDNFIYYVSFSEMEVGSRNSFFQSFPSSLNKYLNDTHKNKSIYFYFLNIDKSKYRIETNYFIFMYRLMKTVGTIFLNQNDYLSFNVQPFASPEDIMHQRNLLRDKNSSNNSTYITKNNLSVVQVIGKTYGANKYETTLMCIALSKVCENNLEVYQVSEQDLKTLPASSIKSFALLGNIDVFTTNKTLEKNSIEENSSLRSMFYIYNLLNKFGDKKCYLCECEIQEIIQGAHIFPISDIKRLENLTNEEKFEQAIDGENGLWLCQNHHKLFDTNIILISENGSILYRINLDERYKKYINNITTVKKIFDNVLTPKFIEYLNKRNNSLNEMLYTNIYI
ncbi:HNH endonuclease signature motif containing protein [Aliarcobacter butzleri]|uniref:HNH endonuclease signature motif containing protein n=1 Tax=Aliarcobacter butzleri TaxID=28197 RepID=UPI00125FEDC3|nr:HNH endonuclease signature motif containing protein [Aliarcobacter butzleri]